MKLIVTNMKFPASIVCGKSGYRMVTLAFLMLSFLPAVLMAETVYITDGLLVGLHEEKSIDSAIIKVLPTGTNLEVIKREDDSVNVRDPEGVVGWISNSYLMNNDPKQNDNLGSDATQSRIRELEAEILNINMQQGKPDQEQAATSDEIAALKLENENLKQQLNSDKLKSGELQANLAELRNQLSQTSNNTQLLEQIKQLSETNQRLEDEIKQLTSNTNLINPTISSPNMGNPMIYSVVIILLGLILGTIFMQWQAKRRLGGLRVKRRYGGLKF